MPGAAPAPAPAQSLDWTGANGIPIHGRHWPPAGEARSAVALVHGLGEHSGRYEHVARRFNQRGHALLAIDLVGHGESGGPRGHVDSYETFLSEISRLIARCGTSYPGKPLFLYGHSLGGGMVLYHLLSRREPVLAAIVTAPALRPAFDPPAWKLALAKWLEVLWPSLALGNGLDPNELAQDPAVVAAYRADPLVHDRISARLYGEWTRSVREVFARADQFPVPLLMLHGTADRIISPAASAQLAQRLGPTCDYRPLEGCRHEPHNETNKDEILGLILEWMDRQLDRATSNR